jgi:HPt (histidine-containing phosphotransfer) domain-containing protein
MKNMRKKNINLNYLNKISDNNNEIIKEMISIYISGIPEILDNLNSALLAQNWELLRQTAHKNKSSVLIMGLSELSNNFGELEKIIIEKVNLALLPELVKKISISLKESEVEAQELITAM